MDLGADLTWIGISLKIFFIDVLLGGDNAIVIALACRGLPAKLIPRAIALGALGAVFFRVVIAAMAGTLLVLPTLKIAAGALLALIAINLLASEYRREGEAEAGGLELDRRIVDGNGYLGAAFVILVADAIMSLDNVVALAAVSEGNYLYLIGGLVFSIPFLFYGSLIVAEAMKYFPALIMVGTALLGWIAGELIVSDPLWAGWIRGNAEALLVFLPAAMAIFVVVEAKITAEARDAEDRSPRFIARPKPVAPRPPKTPTPPVAAAVAPRPAAEAAVVAPRRVEAPGGAAPVVAATVPPVPAAMSAPVDPTLKDRNERIVMIGLIGMAVVVAVMFMTALWISSRIDLQ